MRKKVKNEVNGNLALKTKPIEQHVVVDRSLCLTFLANAKESGFNDKKFSMLPVSLLRIDYTYQREQDESHIREMMQKWDANLCDNLIVSFRDNDTEVGFFVIDGGHRLEVAKRKNIDMLPCDIYEGKTPEWDATTYRNQGQYEKKLDSFDRFQADVARKDATALIVKRVCDEYRVQYHKAGRSAKPVLGGMSSIMSACAKYGEDGVKWILDTIQKLGWYGDRNAYRSSMVRALGNVYGAHEDKEMAQRMIIFCVGRHGYTPDEIIVQALSESKNRRETIALTKFFDAFCAPIK